MSVPIRASASSVRASSTGVLATGGYRPGYPSRSITLPGRATPRERSIAAADVAVSDLDTDLIRRVGGPDIAAVPAGYLPVRAEMAAVIVWDPLWPEAIQRAVIEASPDVHRHLGTPYAVKTALGALGVQVDLIEWWQRAPQGVAYTFTVRATVQARLYDGPLLDPRTIDVVYASILRAKPLSRPFDLIVSSGTAAQVGMAPVVLPRLRVALAAVPILPPGASI